MSRTQRDNIFTQAAFHKDVWELAVGVMNKYELGQLKMQKLNRKHLLAAPEFKQHHFQPLHHLDYEFQKSTLQNVLDEKLTLDEMKQSAAQFRSLSMVKSVFMRLTGCKSWVDAEQTFPTFVTEGRLQQYCSLDFKKSIPEVFRTFCQAALDSHQSEPRSSKRASTYTLNGTSVVVIADHFRSTSAQQIQDFDPSFSGAHLIICRISAVSV